MDIEFQCSCFAFYSLFFFKAKLVQLRMDVIIWGSSSFSAKRGTHWDIQFFPVQGVPPRKVTVQLFL